MKSKPQDLAQLAGQRFAQLQQQTSQTSELQQAVLNATDPAIHSQIRVANMRGGTLVIEIASATWVTRLQYQRLELLSQLRRDGFPMLSSIEFKVNPKLAQITREKPKATKQLSANASDHINALAERLDGELAAKLKKLAAHRGGQ
ncbi:DUF721 domain-containing protein [Ferrimonas lipolytica]|uniref:DUF721 domain-containing protein n=1 Tax=Ferrimonas lipolytica TaxID=2724191 RepID=A0A6H1UIT2_9GAMM|nr:DciA family protein [Ferrimonas lipolytica]QIZ78539.1 DUF721 domain-containing protein [Ferrimonas lipolytica]